MSLILFCRVAEGQFYRTIPGDHDCDLTNTDVYMVLIATYGQSVWSIGTHPYSSPCKEIGCVTIKKGSMRFSINTCQIWCEEDQKKVAGDKSAVYPDCCDKCVQKY
ncbi:Uncharacterised protein g11103 [Pycnogonum litorale]